MEISEIVDCRLNFEVVRCDCPRQTPVKSGGVRFFYSETAPQIPVIINYNNQPATVAQGWVDGKLTANQK